MWGHFLPLFYHFGGAFCPHSRYVAKIQFKFTIHTNRKLSRFSYRPKHNLTAHYRILLLNIITYIFCLLSFYHVVLLDLLYYPYILKLLFFFITILKILPPLFLFFIITIINKIFYIITCIIY